MSLGKDPARLGSKVAGCPALACSDARVQSTQGLCRSSRVAPHTMPRVMATSVKPWASRCSRKMASTLRQSVPTTKRNWQCATACEGMALMGRCALPAPSASISSVFQPTSCSAGVRPGSPQPGVNAGSSAPVPIVTSFSAVRSLAGTGGGSKPLTRMRPLASTRVAMACVSTVAGLASTPPQLPEW
ncbi:hypothetical protein D3C71_1655390 [compost metagenome]